MQKRESRLFHCGSLDYVGVSEFCGIKYLLAQKREHDVSTLTCSLWNVLSRDFFGGNALFSCLMVPYIYDYKNMHRSQSLTTRARNAFHSHKMVCQKSVSLWKNRQDLFWKCTKMDQSVSKIWSWDQFCNVKINSHTWPSVLS